MDLSDESVEWLKYFQEFGITQEALKQLVVVDGKTERPKILAAQGTGCYDRFFKSRKIWARWEKFITVININILIKFSIPEKSHCALMPYVKHSKKWVSYCAVIRNNYILQLLKDFAKN